MNNKIISRQFFFLLLLVPVSALNILSAAEQSDEAAQNSVIEDLKVTVKPLADLLIESTSSAPATVVSLNHATLSAEITGQAKKLAVQVGDAVSAGDVIATIDCSDYQLAEKQAKAALKAAKAQQDLAQKQYTRNLQLRKSQTIPQSMLDESIQQTTATRADIAVKQSALEQAQLAISRCVIKAPFSGQITARYASLGQLLTPASPVVRLLQTDAVEIKAEMTASDIASAEQASGISFSSGGKTMPISFRAVVQNIEVTSRTQEVRLKPGNYKESAKLLVVGSAGRVEWTGTQRLLPADYVLRRDGRLGVMIVTDGKARFHILPDASEGQPAQIDLPADTRVIDLNRFLVKDKQSLSIR